MLLVIRLRYVFDMLICGGQVVPSREQLCDLPGQYPSTHTPPTSRDQASTDRGHSEEIEKTDHGSHKNPSFCTKKHLFEFPRSDPRAISIHSHPANKQRSGINRSRPQEIKKTDRRSHKKVLQKKKKNTFWNFQEVI